MQHTKIISSSLDLAAAIPKAVAPGNLSRPVKELTIPLPGFVPAANYGEAVKMVRSESSCSVERERGMRERLCLQPRVKDGSCLKCFVNFDTPRVGAAVKLCRLCSPGWAKQLNPRKKEKEEVIVGSRPDGDRGARRLAAALDYNKRKRTVLGLYSLEDFSSQKNKAAGEHTVPGTDDDISSGPGDALAADGVGQEAEAQEPPELPVECQYIDTLCKLARKCVEFLKVDRGMIPVSKLPEVIRCGGLRPAVRSVYAKGLSISDELSIKTSQKLELSACKFCLPTFEQRKVDWREKVGRPREVDDDHLNLFRKVLKNNVSSGWDRFARETAFVPNGHGALLPQHSRKNGGNWNREEFSDACRTELVFSSGKPRVVTLFSSHNQEVLRPLHRSLYASLRRFGWLLQGPPTDEKIARLEGGDYHSFDFASATDSLGSRYVSALLDELERKASLNADQRRCMRVLERQNLGDGWSESGQPMGSLMSFPMLCIINKTLMDMALADSLGILHNRTPKGALSTFSSHRCWINGDDALTRDPPGQKKNFRDCFVYHGGKIGLVVNREKSLRSPIHAEINSTVFTDGKEEKKTNLKILGIGKKDVGDIIAVVNSSVVTDDGFAFGLSVCSDALALQQDKKVALHVDRIGIMKNRKKIRSALRVRPTSVIEKEKNLFPVVVRPDGYDLFPSQEKSIIESEVSRLRSLREFGSEFNSSLYEQRKRIKQQTRKASYCDPMNVHKVCRIRAKASEDTILSCLSRAWFEEKKDLTDNRWFMPADGVPEPVEKDTRSTIERLIQVIRCPRIT